MNSIFVTLIVDVLTKLPEVAKDVEDAIKAAESPEDGKAKAKAIMTDLQKVLSALIQSF